MKQNLVDRPKKLKGGSSLLFKGTNIFTSEAVERGPVCEAYGDQ